MPTTDRKLRVFLCHASQDKSVVRDLYKRLLAVGWINPWLDEEKLLPGQDWDLEIEKAVETADVVIVCLSANSVTKEGYIQKELKFVLDIALEKPDGTIFIVPVKLENYEVPRRIRGWQWVDFYPKTKRGASFRKIIQSLEKRSVDLGIRGKGDKFLSDGSQLEWVQKRIIRIGKAAQISETDYVVRKKVEKKD